MPRKAKAARTANTDRPTDATEGLRHEADAIVHDLEGQVEAIRNWHAQADQKLKDAWSRVEADRAALRERAEAQDAEHARRTEALDGRAAEVDQLEKDLTKRTRGIAAEEKRLAKEAAAVEDSASRLERERAAVAEAREQLAHYREDLDAEWAAATRVQRACESLRAALESERERTERRTLPFAGAQSGDTAAPSRKAA